MYEWLKIETACKHGRHHLRAKALRNPMSFLNRLLDPRSRRVIQEGICSSGKTIAHEYGANARERVPDQIRRSICPNMIAPVDVRQHLMLNQQRLDAADAISDEIGESCEVVGGSAKMQRNEHVKTSGAREQDSTQLDNREWPQGHGNDLVKGEVNGKGKGKTKGKLAADQKGTSR